MNDENIFVLELGLLASKNGRVIVEAIGGRRKEAQCDDAYD